jgi:hypothetical protein
MHYYTQAEEDTKVQISNHVIPLFHCFPSDGRYENHHFLYLCTGSASPTVSEATGEIQYKEKSTMN